MATLQPNLSTESPPAVSHAARRAQRIALIMFAVFSTLAVVAGIRSWTTSQWTLWIGMAVLAAYAVATLVAWRQFGAGRQTRGGWILISGLYFVFPIGAVLTEGTSLALALCLFTLTMLLARATLPQADTARAIVIALALSAVTLILGVVDIPVRAQVPYADALLPFLTIGLLVGLVVLLVRGFPTFSLRTKLIFMSLTVSLVPLGVIGLVFAINAQQNATAAANQALAAASRETAASFDTFIQTNLNDVRVASQIPELVDILRSTDRESAAYADAEARATGILRSLRRRDPIFLRSYALLDKDGNNLLDTSRVDMGLSEANRNYFVSPRTDNLPYVSPVTSEPNTGRPSVYFSAPMRDNSGAFLGVLRARYDALVLQETIFNNNGLAGSESGAILLDENNIKLADGLQPDDAPQSHWAARAGSD